jgi:YHS domain-containing protein
LFTSSEEKAKFDSNPGSYFDADVLMDGISPVSLVDEEVLSRGDKEFLVIYDGRRVYLVTETEKEKFSVDPGRYYPTLGGLDPVAMFQGEPAAGIARLSVVYKNRLYMTSSEKNRQEFLVNPVPYSDLDVAFGGNCPVTLVDENRKQLGHYAISVVSRGRRILFVNDQKRKLFLENPRRYDK